VDGPVEKPLWRRIVDFPLMSMLIALVIAIACFTVGALIAQFLLPPTPALPRQTRFDLVSIPILLLGYELLIRRLGEHPKDDFRDPRALRNLGLGLAAGFMLFSLAVGVVALLGVYRITGPGDASGLVAALVGSAIFPAVSEELVFRGILFRWLEEFGGSWMALLLTSALFGASHLANPNATWIAALGLAFEAGVMLGAAYMLTRSLWMPMGIHAAWNFAQGELYDIPVSGHEEHGLVTAKLSGPPLLTGNGFGLEASLIAIILATAFGCWLLWLAIRRGQLMSPWWVRRRLQSADA
jgi:membrane protease YdiL (CAAX protease family)